jgi:hypothetical protein
MTYPPISIKTDGATVLNLGIVFPECLVTTVRKIFVHSLADRQPPELLASQLNGGNSLTFRLTDLGITPLSDGAVLRREYELQVCLDAEAEPGSYTADVMLADAKTTDAAYSLSLPVKWAVKTATSLEPQRWIVDHQALKSDVPCAQTLTVKATRDQPFKIEEIHTEPAGVLHVQCDSAPVSSLLHRLVVTLDRVAIRNMKRFVGKVHIRILSTSPSGSSYTEVFPVVVKGDSMLDIKTENVSVQ